MSIYFSPSVCGFFHSAIHGTDVPDDGVAISSAEHAMLLQGQASGSIIRVGASGRPVLIDPPAPSPDQVRAALRAERDRLLAASDYTQMPDSPLPTGERQAWRIYRQQLRDLPASMANPAEIAWPASPTA